MAGHGLTVESKLVTGAGVFSSSACFLSMTREVTENFMKTLVTPVTHHVNMMCILTIFHSKFQFCFRWKFMLVP